MKKPLLIGSLIGLIIILLITFVLVFGKSLLWVPKLKISETSWNFGTAKVGSDVKHTLIIKNTGWAKLTAYPYPSCPACLALEMKTYDIPPQSEVKLNIKVIETEAGPYEGYIMLDSNDPKQPVKKLTVKGMFIK